MMFNMTHDLSCAFGDLSASARRFTLPSFLESDQSVHGELAVAAVRFAVQLAIDHGDRDPEEMRKLESDLIAKIAPPI
jgi:hypothetical protein